MFFDFRQAILSPGSASLGLDRRWFLGAATWGICTLGGLSGLAPPETWAHPLDPPTIGPAPPPRPSDGKKRLLRNDTTKNLHRRVRILLEARGDLKLNDGSQKATDDKIRRIPMEVKGELAFSERMLSAEGDRSVRLYDKAEARIRIGEGGVKPDLREARRIVVAKRSKQIRYRAAQGPLRRGELDLLRTQGDPLALSAILPAAAVAVGESWAPEASAWTRVLALDSVTQSDVKASLTKHEGDVALVDFSGMIDGAVAGVATEIQLRGKMNVDTRRNAITWFAISAKEKRAISPAEPGVEATSRLRVAIQLSKPEPKIAATAIAGLPTDIATDTGILELESSKIGFSLIHDPRWRLMIERPQVAIFRMVEEGEVLAQCNISRLTPRPVERPFTLKEFQQDIQLSLEKQFGQFVEAQQYEGENGQTVLRVSASGIAQNVPIHWVYYHLTDSRGQRLTVAFTLDAKMVERFGGADRTLVNSLQINAAPQPRAAAGSGSANPMTP